MADYKQLYFFLFNKYTELTQQIATIQQEAEERYLQMDDQDELNTGK